MKNRHIVLQSLPDLPSILIGARTFQGITQRDLADKLGLKHQQIQRWEKQQYAHITFHNLLAVTKALNIEVTLAGAYP